MTFGRTALLAGTVGFLCLAATQIKSQAPAPAEPSVKALVERVISKASTSNTGATNEEDATVGLSLPLRQHLASHIIGMRVENRDGEVLGTVKDFVVDTRQGEVRYAVVSSGGFLGLTAEQKIVPASAISLATVKRKTVALEVSTHRWQHAPRFKKSELAILNDSRRAEAIRVFYEPKNGARHALAPNGTDSPGRPIRVSPTERGAERNLRLASTLLGCGVQAGRGETIGKVTDLLTDLSGRHCTFGIISARKLVKQRETFAVPLRDLQITSDGRVRIEAAPTLFAQAQPFASRGWRNACATSELEIFRFDETEANNTLRNARDRASGALDPFDQFGDPNDRRLTQLIRHALIRDHSLSLTAKNIKIITINHKVTLRGPVKRDAEKQEISRTAQEIAGVQNVVNQLEVESQ